MEDIDELLGEFEERKTIIPDQSDDAADVFIDTEFSMREEEEQREIDGSEEYGQDYDEEEELHILSSDENMVNINTQIPSQRTRRYQHPLSVPLATAGSISVGLGKARLYGLKVTNTGEVQLPSTISTSSTLLDQGKFINKISSMSNPAKSEFSRPADEFSFKPSRSKEAEAAMRNPRLGYDFIARLNEASSSDVLDRLTHSTAGKKGLGKSALESLEADYKAKFDKLRCPTCKKEQSFDEFIEKRRICAQCNQRFVKMNVSSGAKFSEKNSEHEARRRDKLAKIEEEMYGKMEKKRRAAGTVLVPLVHTHANPNVTASMKYDKLVKQETAKGDIPPPVSSKKVVSASVPISAPVPAPAVGPQKKTQSTPTAIVNATGVLDKIKEINQKSNQILDQALAEAQSKYTNSNNDQDTENKFKQLLPLPNKDRGARKHK